MIDLTCDLGSEERQEGVRGDQEPELEEGGEQQCSDQTLKLRRKSVQCRGTGGTGGVRK